MTMLRESRDARENTCPKNSYKDNITMEETRHPCTTSGINVLQILKAYIRVHTYAYVYTHMPTCTGRVVVTLKLQYLTEISMGNVMLILHLKK